MTTATPTSLLAEPDFRRWFAARTISQAGGMATTVAVTIVVYRDSGSATLTAMLTGLAVLPYLLAGLFAGVVADRVDRKRLMVVTDLIGAGLLLALVAAWPTGLVGVWPLLALVLGLATCQVWFDAAAFGALPLIVGRERLARANSLTMSSTVVMGITVPAATGFVVTLTSPWIVLAVDAVTYLVSAALMAGLRVGLRAERTSRPRGVAADIAEGLRFIWRQPIVRTMTLTGSGFALAGGGVTALTVVHADRVLGLSPEDGRLGLVYAAAALGSLAAAAALPRLSRVLGYGRMSIAGYLVVLLSLPLLAVVPLLPAALLLWFVWDAGYTAAITNAITVRQLVTPDELQGRVNMTGRMIALAGTPCGALLAGPLADTAGVTTTYLVLSVPVALGLVVLLASPVRGYRD